MQPKTSPVSNPPTMAISSLLRFFLLISAAVAALSQPPLNSPEQEAVYTILESVSSDVNWRALFPDDLCSSAPHGVVCDLFSGDDGGGGVVAHVTELSFGYVSDYSPNPPCGPKSAIDGSVLALFPHLRRLFFYRCFMESEVWFPDLSSFGSDLEELVFVENPGLSGSIRGNIGKLRNFRRFVLAGSNVSGEIPAGFWGLPNIEQVTISRNRVSGEIPASIQALKKLRVLDLSQNQFSGEVPATTGNLTQLLKLDLSFNRFSGEIPASLRGLKQLEFLDLSYNRFSGGFPAAVSEMTRLKELYLSGNFLGGAIPEIWENMGGVERIGLSKTGLIGEIPKSMGVYLKKVCYLGLDSNFLQGTVPLEFGALENVNELNLENNNLSGTVPFSPSFVTKIGDKLKLQGNPWLCVDQGLRSLNPKGSLGNIRLCSNISTPKSAPLLSHSLASPMLHSSTSLIIFWILCLFS